MAVLRVTSVVFLRVKQDGSFTCNTVLQFYVNAEWQFYVGHRVEILRITEGGEWNFCI